MIIDNARKWFIVEDNPNKAEYLISYILLYFSNDEIHWFYADKINVSAPRHLKGWHLDKNPKYFKRHLSIKGNNYKHVEGKVYFYGCYNETLFNQYFDEVSAHGNGIILLDMELEGLGGVRLDSLTNKGRSYLKREDYHSIVTLTTRQVSLIKVIEKINPSEDKVLGEKIVAIGGRWMFSYVSLQKDCEEVILESDKRWKNVFERNKFTLEKFLEKMSQLNQADCHNWLDWQKDTEDNTWDKEMKMPKQLVYLIKLLDYSPEEFINLFDLKESGHYKNDSPISDCLKTLGTKDENTYSFSLLGTTLICWAAYRVHFKEGRGNQYFIKAIQNSSTIMARRQNMTPPQQLDTLQDTMLQLYKMMLLLYPSSLANAEQPDNLQGVELTERGLKIYLAINPEKLQQAISDEYRRRFKGVKTVGGGYSSQNIVDFFAKSNYCDRRIMDRKSFIGSSYGVQILAAGEHNKHGVIIKFGNEDET